MLWLYRRIIFGPLTKDDVRRMLDLTPREIAIFAPLVLVVFWMGIYPSSFLTVFGPTVDGLIHNYQTALHEGSGHLVALAR
jgi:NADH-quinone oxidoreductase subunit M